MFLEVTDMFGIDHASDYYGNTPDLLWKNVSL